MAAAGPSPADLALIDPDGSFRLRLARDRDALVRLGREGNATELEATVHRLAGAAETFGYAAIGAVAVALDDALVAARETGTVPPAVTSLVEVIAAELNSRD